MPTSNSTSQLESGQEQEPRKESPKFEEFQIPPIGVSPITGLPQTPVWGAINKPHQYSRWAIGDADSDDEFNWLPMGGSKLQIPGNATAIATLVSPMIWQTEVFLNGQAFIYSLCQNGHIYQTNSSGATTDVYAGGTHTQTGTLVNLSNIVTGLSNTAVLSVGESVTGTNIPANTTVSSIDSPSQIHISNNATGGGSFALTFSTPLFTTSGIVDIASWQATFVIFSDSAAQKVYSWDGTTLLIVFNAQPVTYITVFGGRLWMGQNSTIQWTAGGTYNSLGGDSGSFLITDNSCSNPISILLDSPYGLMFAGSNWIKFAVNFQDVGAPAVLTFQQNTLESQIGILSKWTVIIIGNVIFFSNTAGVWALNGGQPAQISAPFLNGFFANFDYTKTSLSAAYGVINSTPCMFLQAYYKGDTQVAAGYTVFGYTLQGQQWFRYVQGTIAWISGNVSFPNTAANPQVWGCDGTNIFQMFTNTSVLLNAQWNSKLWPFGSPLDLDNVLNVAAELILTGSVTITATQLNETNQPILTTSTTLSPNQITIINNFGQLITIVNNSLVLITIVGVSVAAYNLYQTDGLGRSRRMAINLTINGMNSTLIGVTISLHRTGAGRGS